MLNQSLSAPELAREYAVHRRLRIADILAPGEADKLYECLHTPTLVPGFNTLVLFARPALGLHRRPVRAA